MKTCMNCGAENQDDATSCQSCNTSTFVSSSPEATGGHIISPAEQRFWERMTFRQFAVVFIRMQAIWFFFYAILDVTYLGPYLLRLTDILSSSPDYAASRRSLFWLVLRMMLNLAGAMACIQYAERMVSRLVKDLIPKPNPKPPEPAGGDADPRPNR